MTFSEDLRRLEEIVRSLEGQDLDLDQALALFEEGVTRLRSARTLLEAAEAKVQQVVADADGLLHVSELGD